jgi:L-aspartate oxidase
MIATPERFNLPYTSDVERATAHLYAKVARTVTTAEWELYAPYIARIDELKRERNAILLAHHYQSAEIYRCVADVIGDSLALAQAAASTEADTIVMCGVHFMAETAKLLNPSKTVLLPDLRAGCSLAESITADDVRALRAAHPGVPVVTYVNTSAAVKAESDVCCTSANAVAVVESLGVPKVIFLPDQYLAAFVAAKTRVEIVSWQGHCEVHERFTGEEITELREMHAGIVVLAHPECPPDVLARAGRDDHRVLDGGQPGRRLSGDRVHAAVQPLPAHAAHHLAQHPARARDDATANRDRSRDRESRAAGRRADDGRAPGSGPGMSNARSFDAIVVGGGLAGMLTALELAPRRVALVSYGSLGEWTSSAWAQGGIAAAVGDDDSPALHAADTVAAGGGLVEKRVAARLAADAPHAIARIAARGVRFDRDGAVGYALGREGAHSRRRILRAGGDATGAELVRAIALAVRSAAHVTPIEGAQARNVLFDADGSVAGLEVRLFGGTAVAFSAPNVVLATGGVGGLYRFTTNPTSSRGSGIALAARAGARLADMEFVQFHPTALDVPADPLPLVTEALRGEGALLVDARGNRVMDGIDPSGELASRDVVARRVFALRRAGERAYLDARHIGGKPFAQRFPTVFAACMRFGIDPRNAPIPIVPAAHYHMGGIAVDLDGRTSVPGLYACGEVAATGVHGANRLASNSLLESVVYPERIARDINAYAAKTSARTAKTDARAELRDEAPAPVAGTQAEWFDLRGVMYEGVGVERDEAGLLGALDRLERFVEESPSEDVRDAATVGSLIARAALRRRETRGSHARTDYPEELAAERHRSFSTPEDLSRAAHTA